MANRNSEIGSLRDDACDPCEISYGFPHEDSADWAENAMVGPLKRRSLEDEPISFESHTCKCGDKVSSPQGQIEPIASQLVDLVNHLLNENRQMKQEFSQMRQSLQQYQQADRIALEKAHEKLDRITVWIDSQTIGNQKPAHETSHRESKVPPKVTGNSEPRTCLNNPGELIWTVDDYQERRRQLTSNIIRCLDSPEFETRPTGYRMRLRLWMSQTGVEIAVKMLDSHPDPVCRLSWPVCCQVTVGLVEKACAEEFMFQESLSIEYKTVTFYSQSVLRFPIAQVNRAASRNNHIIIKCLATDNH